MDKQWLQLLPLSDVSEDWEKVAMVKQVWAVEAAASAVPQYLLLLLEPEAG